VAVAVGLHHGEDFPARAHHLAHGTDVRGGGIEVDLEGGRPGGETAAWQSWQLLIREDTRMLRLGIACVGLFVLTSGAMANEITPAVRSELAPTASSGSD